MILRTENKNGLVGEWVQQNGYCLCQLVAVVPSTFVVVGQRVRDLPARGGQRCREAPEKADETANPLGANK